MQFRSLHKFYFLALLLTQSLFVSAQPDSLPLRATANAQNLATYFDSTRYIEVFMMGYYSNADSIWDLDSSQSVLENIVLTKTYSTRSRFFACEIIFDHSDWFPHGDQLATVAEIYATALPDNYTDFGNPWGTVQDTSDVGDIGENILPIGEWIVVQFRPLLNCETPVHYIGSREATVGNDGHYRVKDIAANYICAVRGIAFDGRQDQKGRDKQIRKLKRIL